MTITTITGLTPVTATVLRPFRSSQVRMDGSHQP
jgi:hypothetical protein